MAEHAEGHGRHEGAPQGKHGDKMERMKTVEKGAGLATLGANFALAGAAGIVFPLYVLAIATGATVAAFHEPGAKPEKKKHAGHGHDAGHH